MRGRGACVECVRPACVCAGVVPAWCGVRLRGMRLRGAACACVVRRAPAWCGVRGRGVAHSWLMCGRSRVLRPLLFGGFWLGGE